MMSAVTSTDRWQRVRSRFSGALGFIRRAVTWLRGGLSVLVTIIVIGATAAAVIWLHSAARTSPDAWPTSVAAGTTAFLTLITLWYAYVTHRLLDAQRAAPRIAGWETALRELSLFLNRERAVLWTTAEYFSALSSGAGPAELKELIASKDKVAVQENRCHSDSSS